jgi:hypothetical protein
MSGQYHDKGVNSVLSFFKLGLHGLAFVINSLKTALNTSQKGFYHIKVLKVF